MNSNGSRERRGLLGLWVKINFFSQSNAGTAPGHRTPINGCCAMMGSRMLPFVVNVLFLLSLQLVAARGFTVKFLTAPRSYSSLDSATFGFEIEDGRNWGHCGNCSISCKLDSYNPSNCESREASYIGLPDGEHVFEVCISRFGEVSCAAYNWTVDTVSPTAYVSSATSFTNAVNVSVHVAFSEPCPGRGGFRCSLDHCNLLVYGAGYVLPSTFNVLRLDLEFTVLVGISADAQFGRLVLVMDKNFCTDAAGNSFTRTSNSSFFLHFDRRNVMVNLTTHIRKKLLQLNGDIRSAEATNNNKNLRIYLYFSEPVLNSSAEIMGVLRATSGLLYPTKGRSLGNRRFGYIVSNISGMAIVTVTCETSFIISRQGTRVSPSVPVTFLYDTRRPSVKLTSNKMRTRERNVPVLIKFVKPVFDFNSSAIRISGGHLLSFQEVSMGIFKIELHASDYTLSIEIPENSVADVAGNKNLASNRLQIRHYSTPVISSLLSTITAVVFLATSVASALLSVTTASLLAFGTFSRPENYIISEPSRNLLRITSHIQIFALTKWLGVNLPIEYFEFVGGIEWSIPYLTLPWENMDLNAIVKDSSFPLHENFGVLKGSNSTTYKPVIASNWKPEKDASVYGTPLTAMEYRSFLENQDMTPEAEFIMDPQNRKWWTFFGRNMLWLAIIGGGLILLHAAILFVLKTRSKSSEKRKDFGALVFPRFEIFLLFLALPCICQASATIIRGGSTPGIVVGVLLSGFTSSLLLSMLLFLSFGITMGKLLQYKEVHREGQELHWYREIIRVTLGPGKLGQWTWKDHPNSVNLTKLGALFEDLRGPPKYMLSQIAGEENRRENRGGRIIASDDETEDAEAPYIQKLFGVMRIYYTLLETVKRVSLGIIAGAYSSPSRVPTIVLLSITAFQLFFLLMKKPFIKKKVQLVEIISVASELCVFSLCLVLLGRRFSDDGERRMGIFMMASFVVGFLAQMVNEWLALYRQVVRLSPGKDSFISGSKTSLSGLLLIFLPARLSSDLSRWLSSNHGGPAVSEMDRRSSSTSASASEKPWIRQLRELAKAGFSKEDGRAVNDPSSSSYQRRSGFWSGKRSGSSSMPSSADFKAKVDQVKAKSKGMYSDLEAIFSSK